MELLLAFFNPVGRELWPSVIGRILLALGILTLAGAVGYQLGMWVLIPLLATGWHLFEAVVTWLTPTLGWTTFVILEGLDSIWRGSANESAYLTLVWYGCFLTQGLIFTYQVALEEFGTVSEVYFLRPLYASATWVVYFVSLATLWIRLFTVFNISPATQGEFASCLLPALGFVSLVFAHFSLTYPTYARHHPA